MIPPAGMKDSLQKCFHYIEKLLSKVGMYIKRVENGFH